MDDHFHFRKDDHFSSDVESEQSASPPRYNFPIDNISFHYNQLGPYGRTRRAIDDTSSATSDSVQNSDSRSHIVAASVANSSHGNYRGISSSSRLPSTLSTYLRSYKAILKLAYSILMEKGLQNEVLSDGAFLQYDNIPELQSVKESLMTIRNSIISTFFSRESISSLNPYDILQGVEREVKDSFCRRKFHIEDVNSSSESSSYFSLCDHSTCPENWAQSDNFSRPVPYSDQFEKSGSDNLTVESANNVGLNPESSPPVNDSFERVSLRSQENRSEIPVLSTPPRSHQQVNLPLGEILLMTPSRFSRSGTVQSSNGREYELESSKCDKNHSLDINSTLEEVKTLPPSSYSSMFCSPVDARRTVSSITAPSHPGSDLIDLAVVPSTYCKIKPSTDSAYMKCRNGISLPGMERPGGLYGLLVSGSDGELMSGGNITNSPHSDLNYFPQSSSYHFGDNSGDDECGGRRMASIAAMNEIHFVHSLTSPRYVAHPLVDMKTLNDPVPLLVFNPLDGRLKPSDGKETCSALAGSTFTNSQDKRTDIDTTPFINLLSNEGHSGSGAPTSSRGPATGNSVAGHANQGKGAFSNGNSSGGSLATIVKSPNRSNHESSAYISALSYHQPLSQHTPFVGAVGGDRTPASGSPAASAVALVNSEVSNAHIHRLDGLEEVDSARRNRLLGIPLVDGRSADHAGSEDSSLVLASCDSYGSNASTLTAEPTGAAQRNGFQPDPEVDMDMAEYIDVSLGAGHQRGDGSISWSNSAAFQNQKNHPIPRRGPKHSRRRGRLTDVEDRNLAANYISNSDSRISASHGENRENRSFLPLAVGFPGTDALEFGSSRGIHQSTEVYSEGQVAENTYRARKESFSSGNLGSSPKSNSALHFSSCASSPLSHLSDDAVTGKESSHEVLIQRRISSSQNEENGDEVDSESDADSTVGVSKNISDLERSMNCRSSNRRNHTSGDRRQFSSQRRQHQMTLTPIISTDVPSSVTSSHNGLAGHARASMEQKSGLLEELEVSNESDNGSIPSFHSPVNSPLHSPTRSSAKSPFAHVGDSDTDPSSYSDEADAVNTTSKRSGKVKQKLKSPLTSGGFSYAAPGSASGSAEADADDSDHTDGAMKRSLMSGRRLKRLRTVDSSDASISALPDTLASSEDLYHGVVPVPLPTSSLSAVPLPQKSVNSPTNSHHFVDSDDETKLRTLQQQFSLGTMELPSARLVGSESKQQHLDRLAALYGDRRLAPQHISSNSSSDCEFEAAQGPFLARAASKLTVGAILLDDVATEAEKGVVIDSADSATSSAELDRVAGSALVDALSSESSDLSRRLLDSTGVLPPPVVTPTLSTSRSRKEHIYNPLHSSDIIITNNNNNNVPVSSTSSTGALILPSATQLRNLALLKSATLNKVQEPQAHSGIPMPREAAEVYHSAHQYQQQQQQLKQQQEQRKLSVKKTRHISTVPLVSPESLYNNVLSAEMQQQQQLQPGASKLSGAAAQIDDLVMSRSLLNARGALSSDLFDPTTAESASVAGKDETAGSENASSSRAVFLLRQREGFTRVLQLAQALDFMVSSMRNKGKVSLSHVFHPLLRGVPSPSLDSSGGGSGAEGNVQERISTNVGGLPMVTVASIRRGVERANGLSPSHEHLQQVVSLFPEAFLVGYALVDSNETLVTLRHTYLSPGARQGSAIFLVCELVIPEHIGILSDGSVLRGEALLTAFSSHHMSASAPTGYHWSVLVDSNSEFPTVSPSAAPGVAPSAALSNNRNGRIKSEVDLDRRKSTFESIAASSIGTRVDLIALPSTPPIRYSRKHLRTRQTPFENSSPVPANDSPSTNSSSTSSARTQQTLTPLKGGSHAALVSPLPADSKNSLNLPPRDNGIHFDSDDSDDSMNSDEEDETRRLIRSLPPAVQHTIRSNDRDQREANAPAAVHARVRQRQRALLPRLLQSLLGQTVLQKKRRLFLSQLVERAQKDMEGLFASVEELSELVKVVTLLEPQWCDIAQVGGEPVLRLSQAAIDGSYLLNVDTALENFDKLQ